MHNVQAHYDTCPARTLQELIELRYRCVHEGLDERKACITLVEYRILAQYDMRRQAKNAPRKR